MSGGVGRRAMEAVALTISEGRHVLGDRRVRHDRWRVVNEGPLDYPLGKREAGLATVRRECREDDNALAVTGLM
jgi:hypothetical protein